MFLAKCYSEGWYVPEGWDVNAELEKAFDAEMNVHYAGYPTTAWVIEYEHDTPEHDVRVKESQ